MIETKEELLSFMIKKGWMPEQASCEIERLSGGVSSYVWKINGPDFRWIVKQARPELAVKETWQSDPARMTREREAMQTVRACLPGHAVPAVFHWDDDQHMLVMECAPDQWQPWKPQLLQGKWSVEEAEKVGRLLAQCHRSAQGLSEETRRHFSDLTYFRELRVDPFYRYLQPAHPELHEQLEGLMDELEQDGTTLVHGDFSPKNILVAASQPPLLLDFEVAHWGNPVFDAAFCTAHLLLKGKKFDAPDEMLALIDAFLRSYGTIGDSFMAHVGALLLARMDGKSPVEYIADARKPAIRRWACTFIREGAGEQNWNTVQSGFSDFLRS